MEPTLADVMAELQSLRKTVERYLPGAVSSKGEREKQTVKNRARSDSAARAAAKAAGREKPQPPREN